MATEHSGLLDHSVPQWKRELILRRRAVGRVLPAGSGSVQLTCPSVVAAVRHPEYSVNADFHLRGCASEREQTGGYKNMRLVEQVNTSGEFVEAGVVPDIKELMTKIESESIKHYSKMGEEKNAIKKNGSTGNCEKKSTGELLEDEQLSDSSEEFKYGPGIVSRLKSRYLSLTLRESQAKTRPSLACMRRATSLENILDGPEVEKVEEAKPIYIKNVQTANGDSPQRCRGITRGNKDSMKRARSVEALMRYDRVGSIGNQNRRSLDSKVDELENEERRNKCRNRLSNSILEEKELPPPDVVKQTLKIFETSSNGTKKNIPPVSKINTSPKGDSIPVSATKPIISPKPVLTGKIKLNGANTPTKISSEMETGRLKLSDKSRRSRSIEIIPKESPSPEKTVPVPVSRITSPLDRGKVNLTLKDKRNEPVITKKPLNEVQPSNSESNQDRTDGEEKVKPFLHSNISNISPPKDGMTLDLNETNNKLKSSPLIGTSPKSYTDKKIIESSESTRPISPVLVRAPPCILSSELSTNNSNSPTQHMKQVGVIRPIVTNKTIHSNSTFPSKFPVNKPHSVLTEREIEKNLINKVKSIEQPVTKVIVSLKKSPEECCVGNVNVDTSKQHEDGKKGQVVWDKNQKPNTMVFNFSNRTSVPDYIENDGLILAPRKEKPKRGEPGIIILGGGTDDSSTDFDPEEFDPPSPCDILFEGDNILINGKSNIQTKPKQRKLRIQFNDEATMLFEYPSEASLLNDHEPFGADADSEKIGPSASGLPNPFRGGNLASYTPSKVSMTADFQLGVTKTPTPPPPSSAPPRTAAATSETDEDYLRPADESSTVAWSSETAADLLF